MNKVIAQQLYSYFSYRVDKIVKKIEIRQIGYEKPSRLKKRMKIQRKESNISLGKMAHDASFFLMYVSIYNFILTSFFCWFVTVVLRMISFGYDYHWAHGDSRFDHEVYVLVFFPTLLL